MQLVAEVWHLNSMGPALIYLKDLVFSYLCCSRTNGSVSLWMQHAAEASGTIKFVLFIHSFSFIHLFKAFIHFVSPIAFHSFRAVMWVSDPPPSFCNLLTFYYSLLCQMVLYSLAPFFKFTLCIATLIKRGIVTSSVVFFFFFSNEPILLLCFKTASA